MTSSDTQPESQRGAVIRGPEMRDIHVKLAILSEKLDQVLGERSRITALEQRMLGQELFAAQMKTWLMVGGGVWSLALVVIGAVLWR